MPKQIPGAHRKLLELANERGYFPLARDLSAISRLSIDIGIRTGVLNPTKGHAVPEVEFNKLQEMALAEFYGGKDTHGDGSGI